MYINLTCHVLSVGELLDVWEVEFVSLSLVPSRTFTTQPIS